MDMRTRITRTLLGTCTLALAITACRLVIMAARGCLRVVVLPMCRFLPKFKKKNIKRKKPATEGKDG